MGVLQNIRDGFTNLIAGLATAGDKTYADTYSLLAPSQGEIEAAYRQSWFGKIVDIPPQDATREWRNWQAEDDQIEELEAEEKRLGVRGKVQTAMIYGRLYGGGALVLGVADGLDSMQPLDVERVKQAGLEYIHALSRSQITAGSLVKDPFLPEFGQPEKFTIQGEKQVDIHPSRVIRFIGSKVPDGALLTPADGWGDSLWGRVSRAVKNADLTSAGIAALVHEAKVDVLHIPRLMELVSTAEYTALLTNRIRIGNQLKGINSTYVVDAGNGTEGSGEKWERVQTNFAGLPDVLRIFLAILAGVSDIPATRLLGKSPDGMNATGDSDTRNYYDSISSMQENDLRPLLEPLDECLIRSAFGSRPPEVYYSWAPLWQMSEQESAAIFKTKGEAVTLFNNSSLVPDSALAKAVQNMLVEDGILPGLEAALAEAEAAGEVASVLDPEPTPEEIAAGAALTGNVVPIKKAVGDAAPRTLYVRRNVLNAGALISWASEQGFDTTVPTSEMHVTIAFSRAPIDWMKVPDANWLFGQPDGGMTVPAGGARLVEPLGPKGAVVLLFNSSALSYRHEEIKRAGASWDFPEYQPHITISYDAKGLDLESAIPYRGPIILGPEIFEEVVEDWEKTITEE